MNGLTHFDEQGNARMVDVGEKAETDRIAVAHGFITVNHEVFEAISLGTAKKGDVLGVARVAGIMGAKRTSELIPLCHGLMLTKCAVDFVLHEERLSVEAFCTVKTQGKTMISDICLLKKDGGKSGLYEKDSGGRGSGL